MRVGRGGRRAVWAVFAAVAAGCATRASSSSSEGGGDVPVVTQTVSAPTAPAPVVTQTVSAPTTPEWEPWPPPGARDVRREAATGDVVEIAVPDEGLAVLDLLRVLRERTGTVVLYDGTTNIKMRTVRVTTTGAIRTPASRFLAVCRSILQTHNMLLVPANLDGAGGGFVLYDQNNPLVKTAPMYVAEEDVLAHEQDHGVLIVTALRVRDIVDTSRVRQALMSLTTQTANLGRVQDVPGTRTIVVSDLAPVVVAMKRTLDEINANALPPRADAPAPGPAK